MYCRKCGKQIGDQDQFCDGCGTRVLGPVSNKNSHTPNSYIIKKGIETDRLVSILICLGAAALNVLMAFTTWISVSSLSGWDSILGIGTKSEFILLELHSFSKKADYILYIKETALIKFITSVILLLAIATIVCLVLFGIKLIMNKSNSINIGKAAFTLSIILPFTMYWLVYLVNKQANSGWFDTTKRVLETTNSPFIVLLTGCIGRFRVTTLKTQKIYPETRTEYTD